MKTNIWKSIIFAGITIVLAVGCASSESGTQKNGGTVGAAMRLQPSNHLSAPLQNLGMIGVKSIWGLYLQAHSDNGEMHASNDHRDTEETWFLVEIDKAKHLYALQNWSNGKYMSKQGNCAPANSILLGQTESWTIFSGKPYGIENAVAFKSSDGSFLGSNGPGDDSECGGEVAARDPKGPVADKGWPGWWILEPAKTAPETGHDLWNTIGDGARGLAAQISPADIGALLSALAF